MKKAALYITLLCYCSLMFRPVMPWVADLAAHVFFYKDHMMTVHAHNGKYHVHAEMAQAAKTSQSEKNAANVSKDFPDSEQILLVESTPQISVNESTLNYFYSESIIDPGSQHHFQPPKA